MVRALLWSKKQNTPTIPLHFVQYLKKIPEARTVVLRNANKSRNFISFHSDIRSKKYQQLKDNNNVCALFYDKSRKVQLRVNGLGEIEHKSKSCVKSWNKMSKESKICYLAPLAPSSTTSKFIPNLPSMTPHQITDKDEAYGYQNFCVINIKISKLIGFNWIIKGTNEFCSSLIMTFRQIG